SGLTFNGCKKKKKDTNTNSQPLLYSGQFIYNHSITNSIVTNSVFSSISINDVFFYPAVDFYSTFGLDYYDVGDVSVNGKKLYKSVFSPTSAAYSQDTTYTTFPLNYLIEGKGGFTATSFVDNGDACAGFSNCLQFPDTLLKSAGLNFTLTNLVNTSLVEVGIGNQTFTFNSPIISITASQLSSIPTTTQSNVRVKCTNAFQTVKVFDNRAYHITSTFQYSIFGGVILP
ncbi:MAG: hypothetical protein KDD29_09430, partial [Flavobacteriales bacterium]|nr:hypothetical protein [Flavobacteriales bacterium]